MATKILEDGGEAYETKGGVTVTRRRRAADYGNAISAYVDKLDERRGAVFSSNYEYPGRYTRWDTAVVDPPLQRASPVSQVANASHAAVPASASRAFASVE